MIWSIEDLMLTRLVIRFYSYDTEKSRQRVIIDLWSYT